MMKTKLNFWGVMAAAAIMLSAGVGYVGASSMDTPTHYNTEPDETKSPNWQPIVPNSSGNGDGEAACTTNEERECKAIQLPNGQFQAVENGDYPGL